MLNKYHIIVSSINIRYFFNFLFYTGKPAFPGRGILSSHFRFSIFFTIRVWAASICFTDGERDMQLFGSQTTIASLVLDLPSKFKKWTPISIFHTTPIVFFFGWQSWCQGMIFENRNGSEKTVLDIPPFFSSVLGWSAEKKYFKQVQLTMLAPV